MVAVFVVVVVVVVDDDVVVVQLVLEDVEDVEGDFDGVWSRWFDLFDDGSASLGRTRNTRGSFSLQLRRPLVFGLAQVIT